MIVAVHQPNFVPWIVYFYKIAKADLFIILDDVQFSKNSFTNRNRIKTPAGGQWLTMPVIQSGNFGQKINEVNIQNPIRALKKAKNTIKLNYARAPYFEEVYSLIDPILTDQSNLSVLNEELIKVITSYMGIETKIAKSSEMELEPANSTANLVNICVKVGAKSYLAGFGSDNYQESQLFKKVGIDTSVYDFKHPVYPQLWGDFIPNMSILDFLFNLGPNGMKNSIEI